MNKIKSYLLFSILILVLLTSITSVQAKKAMIPDWSWEPLFTVPALESKATIDGQLDEGEWKYATEIGGLIDDKTGMQTNQAGKFLLGYRQQDLYIGFTYQRPTGGGAPKMQFDQPGWSETPLWVKDDNVEFWLAPLVQDVRMSGMMAPGYCIAANAAGAYSHDATGRDRTEIPRDIEYVPYVKGEFWQGEMRFPWHVVDNMLVSQKKSAPADGVKWKGVLIFHQRTPFHSLFGAQHAYDAFPTLEFSERPIGFEASDLKLIDGGKARFVAGVRNGSDQEVEYELHYDVFVRNEPPKSDNDQFVKYWRWLERIKEVGPNQAAAERGGVLDVRTYDAVLADLNRQYKYVDGGIRKMKASAGDIIKEQVEFPAFDGYYVFGYKIVELNSKKVVMQQVIPTLLSSLPMEIREEYLKAQKLIVRADAAAVNGVAGGDIFEVVLADTQGNILEKATQEIEIGKSTEVILSTEKTQERSSYEVTAKIRSKDTGDVLAELGETLYRPENPEWFDSKLGLTDKVPPGFESLKQVEKGFKLAFREIVLDNRIFPQQIVTRNEDFLAGPIELIAKVDGKEVVFNHEDLIITDAKATGAKLQQQWSGSGLILNIKGKLDYDGFTRYDLKFMNSNEPIRLDELTLVVPVKPEFAEWFTHRELGTKLSGNPAITYLPYGDLEDFYQVYPDGLMPFTWQLFLGTRDRGIEWTAESDRDWSPNNDRKMIGIIREQDRTSMVFRIVDSSVDLSEERNVSFALMPTPIREFPRKLYYTRSRTTGVSLTPEVSLDPDTNPQYIKTYEQLSDFGIGVALHYTNFGPELFSNVRFYDKDQLNKVTGMNRLARAHGIMNVFYCGYSLPKGIPNNETFGNEMRMEPEYRGWYNHGSPYADYFLHSTKFMAEEALVDAFHLDGLNIPWLMNNVTNNYKWFRNGEEHGTYPIFAVRDLFKRFYTMLKFELKDGQVGYSMPHVNEAPVFCIEGFSDQLVTGEQHYNTLSTLKDLSLAQYSLVYSSLEHGVPRMAIWHYIPDIPVTKNTMLTLHNLNGVLYEYIDLGGENPYELMGGFKRELYMWKNFDRVNAEFLPYWQHPNLITVTNHIKGAKIPEDAIKASAHVHKNKGTALIILANLDLYGHTLRVKPNIEALGLKGSAEDYVYVDPISDNYQYPLVADELFLDVYPQRWRAIQIIKK